MSAKRPRSPSSPPSQNLFKSSPIKDRASTFIAAFSPTFSPRALQSLPEFRTATHRMVAWRQPGKQQQLSVSPGGQQGVVLETGYDDDGETFGGKTLEKVLREEGMEGSVVVARWFGGVMLGPVRFEHIRGCAREAIGRGKREGGEEAERGWKKVKEADDEQSAKESDEEERRRLVGVLEERDSSIGVLRGLLAEKKRELEGEPSQGGSVTSSPSKATNYTTMELNVLKRLEQVRDKTIGWILAQIEEVEKAQLEESRRVMSGAAEEEDQEAVIRSQTLRAEKEHDANKRDDDADEERSLGTGPENGATTVRED